jgi:hypothetical protein
MQYVMLSTRHHTFHNVTTVLLIVARPSSADGQTVKPVSTAQPGKAGPAHWILTMFYLQN